MVNAAGLYVTPGLIDIHVHLYNRTNPPPGAIDESVNPDAFSFRSGVTTMVDAGSSGCKDFSDFRDHIIKRARTRVLAFLNIVASGMHTGRENVPRRWMPKAPPRPPRRIEISSWASSPRITPARAGRLSMAQSRLETQQDFR